ncbi:PAQR family membrane homeostasis protein TrhA [Pseudogemmobacter faecipullorum]|uniref:Hemolysin III family protein n=1 Tax=Pseudogemmobacter faecipullorum TaxID=2755041 RepID=A0ABS8CHQ8_9RHOB|nr:hemolysin III family protein [Pseudogemmobacter faecipullorum]MCB5408425.1 hemolysin III family protein [Pseudogemmobacter faecipullorum]
MSLPADHYRLKKRAFSAGELLADGIVHAVALVAGLIAFPILLFHVLQTAGIGVFAALSVYAAGFFLMFGFSLAYNMTPPSAVKWLLRRFDHSMIYVMIAGTYTAILSQFESPAWAWSLGLLVWGCALTGILVKIVLPGRYDRLAILAYILMGWLGIIAIGPVTVALPELSLWLIVTGGLTYIAGVGFYVQHRLMFHNAIWHFFVAVAAGLHFAAIAIAVA